MAEGEAGSTTKLAFVGDIMLSRKVTDAFRSGRAPDAFWGNIRPNLIAADAVIGNLEGALTETRERFGHGFKAFHFCADPGTVAILKAGNVQCVGIANNHTLDGKEAGLFETIGHLDRAGIAHAGAGANLAEARRTTSFTAGGLKIGFTAMTNTLRPARALPDKAGTNYLRFRASDENRALLDSLVAEMNAAGAEFRVLSVHWGPNFRPWPPGRYRDFAKQAIEAGFDLIHGHSAHILQALEYHRHGLILYDTGDILDDYWVFPGFRLDRTFLFEVTVERGRAPALRLRPVTIAPCDTNFAVGDEAETIRHRMIRRCRGYAVEFTADGDALVAHDPTAEAPKRSMASASRTA